MHLAMWRILDASALVRISNHKMDEAPIGYLIPDTIEHAKTLIIHYQKLDPKLGMVYAIWNHLRIIGYIQLFHVKDSIWEVGYYIDMNYQNKGHMSAALAKLIKMVEKQHTFMIMQARVLKNNQASIQVLKHNGFLLINQWDDLLCYHRSLS